MSESVISAAGYDVVVGAQDFLPDFESTSSCVSIANIYPRYQPISSAMQKAKKWIADARVRLFVAQFVHDIYAIIY